jgi:hypothetical protein
MGEKKRKEAETAQWKKVLVVGACVLFVVLMVVSGMGSGWLTMFTIVKPGNSVVVDYTLYDGTGSPIVTTDQQVYLTAAKQGKDILYTRQLQVIANQSTTQTIYPVLVFTGESGMSEQFALFAPEYNAISAGVVGMKTNEQKKIKLMSDSTTQFWSLETLERNNVNMSTLNIGSVLAMGVSDNPEANVTNTSATTYLRVAEVVRKVPTGVTVDFGYPTADIRVVSINNK